MESEKSIEPRDIYKISYILFYALGVLTNIPSHFFTTATDYWMYKFRNTSTPTDSSERTELQAQFLSTYSIVSSVSAILFVILTIFLVKHIRIIPRILYPLCGIITAFIFTLVLASIDTDEWQGSYFITTLVIGAFLSACSSMFMLTMFQLGSRFGPIYIAAILTGQSICGILGAIVQILILGSGTGSLASGFIYFTVGLVFVLCTLISFVLMMRTSEFFRFNLHKPPPVLNIKISKQFIFGVFNKIKYLLFSMIIVLGCSIMTHPGVTGLVVSVNKGNGDKWNDVFFTPVATFLFFYLFDYVGRELAGYFKRPRHELIIFGLSCLRIALVPMIMLCNAQPAQSRSHLSVVFSEDYAYIIFIIIFGLSNGFLVNLAVLRIPAQCTREEINLALGLVVAFMILSLGVCSFFSKALIDAL